MLLGVSPIDPKKDEQLSVRLTGEQLARIDRIAEERKATRAAVIRYVLDKGLPAVEREYGIKSP